MLVSLEVTVMVGRRIVVDVISTDTLAMSMRYEEIEVMEAMAVSTAVESAASRLQGGGGGSSLTIEGEVEKRRITRREPPQRHSRRWKAEGLHQPAWIVLEAAVEVDMGVY